MTALPDFRRDGTCDIADDVVARLPESAFGRTEWLTMSTRAWVQHLGGAIVSGPPHRVANAVRALAHAPALAEVEALANALCDSIVSAGYATRERDTVARVSAARKVIAGVLAELRESVEPAAPAQAQEAVDGYVRLAGMRDPHLAERLDAVGTFAGRIARAMQLRPATTAESRLAGRLHDIGMIGAERGRLERHATLGESFVRRLPSLAHLAPFVRSHHERVDGSGYPDGLHGDEIPLPSRIISVAAAFVDHVTESRQREAMLPHDACRELLQHAGTHFDSDVVGATLHLVHFRMRTTRTA
jgi:HD-GYP domain-containing protein (c-di-GMP phosphodiesterase class II)